MAAPLFVSQPVLTVDLGRIVDNYVTLRARLANAACAAVVKADGYGLGAARVAAALAAAGCRQFFVAHLAEGLALASIVPRDAHVFVLHGLLPGESETYVRHKLVPVLNDLGQIDAWAAEARRFNRALPAAIHIDTGMSRLGLDEHETERLIQDESRLDGLDVLYVMSHLACAEEGEHPLNAEQLARFSRWRAAFPWARASLVNSSGIFLGPDYHFDLARPGSALYGINPVPRRPNPVRQVVRLEGKILQIREVDPPNTVGYGATRRVATRTRIATVAAGYADGWLRTLSNRGQANFGGLRVPIIGRVSMDLITLDITAVPQAAIGDGVELMGDQLSVDEVAELAGTIGYEVLTRIGPRVARVYVNDPAHA